MGSRLGKGTGTPWPARTAKARGYDRNLLARSVERGSLNVSSLCGEGEKTGGGGFVTISGMDRFPGSRFRDFDDMQPITLSIGSWLASRASMIRPPTDPRVIEAPL